MSGERQGAGVSIASGMRTRSGERALIPDDPRLRAAWLAFEPILNEAGFSLVRLIFIGSERLVLQVMIERGLESPQESPTVEDCIKASRCLRDAVELDDPIGGDYSFQVSSPGLDRPLVREGDFRRFVGSKIRVGLLPTYAGRRRLQGILIGLEDDQVVLEVDSDRISLPFSMIQRASLVFETQQTGSAHRPRNRRGTRAR